MKFRIWKSLTFFIGLILFIAAFGVSFFYVMMGKIVGFSGLAQYGMLLSDSEFWLSLLNTTYFVIATVPLSLFISLFIAILLNQKIRALGFYRTIYFLPVVTSLVAVSMVWMPRSRAAFTQARVRSTSTLDPKVSHEPYDRTLTLTPVRPRRRYSISIVLLLRR